METINQESELVDLLAGAGRLVPVGSRSKDRLCVADDGDRVVSLTGLSGILEYDASEYTFTARAGTPVAEMVAALAEKGQSLPFDPLLVKAGATLGGTVAAGFSGPGRFRFGGIRDFLLAVRYLDGEGRSVRSGGKVVKNAAGFDLPKFMVGSLGRCGVLLELTFKVFPTVGTRRTVRIPCADAAEASDRMAVVSNSRWETEALDYHADDGAIRCRLSGPERAVEILADEIVDRWEGETLDSVAAAAMWEEDSEFAWIGEGRSVAKVPLSLSKVPGIAVALEGIAGTGLRVSSGGNVAWVAFESSVVEPLSSALTGLGLRGMTFKGSPEVPLWLGSVPKQWVATALADALDASNSFPRF